MRRPWMMMAGLLVATASCARHGGSEDEESTPKPVSRTVVVHVVNNYRSSMEVYAVGSGIQHRLGLVSAGLSRDFVLLEQFVNAGGVEFMAQPSGQGPSVRTGEVRFSPGDTLDFMITTNLVASHANVRM